ncbi:MAG TPA: sulfur oxidation c-type cytochrome SoxX [Chromatiales bacterium]|nr:sulfur oxidation c-type cytochrome SoxX [Chromatiales bacterium]
MAASLGVLVACATAQDKSATPASESAIEQGKKLAFDRKKGNCLACHQIAGGTLPGDIGPPLVAMKARYPDKAKLREQIWDARKKNPHTIMPPFGAHRILTEKEIDLVTDFIYTL